MKKTIRITIILFVCFKAEAQTSALQLADELFNNGKYSEAIVAYNSIEDKTHVYHKIAKANVAIGNYEEALNNYVLSIDSNPDNLLYQYEYAKLLSKTKNFEAASTQFEILIKADSLNPNYYYERGLVLEQQKDSTAQLAFEKAYMLDSNHHKAIFKIAKKYLSKRQFEEAHRIADIGLNQYSKNVELISIKAQSYYWQEYYDRAKEWFNKLIDLNENSQFIHEKLSFCYVRLYDYKNAIHHQELALNYDKKNATNLYVLGQLHDENSNYPEAEKYYKQAIEIWDDPIDAEYIKLGTVLNLQYKHTEAIEAFTKAKKENPANESVDMFILFTQEKLLKNTETKIKLYEDYLSRYPDHPFKKIFDVKIKQLKEEQFLAKD